MKKMRRIVTGFNDEGQSIILMDTASTNEQDLAPGVRATKLWETETLPVDNASFQDMGEGAITMGPANPAGSYFSCLQFAPGEGVDQPFMHATNTLDYITVIKGEIYCVMEAGEVLLKVGDTLIQRGTKHAWVNRSNEVCEFMVVAVAANPLS